MIARLEASLQTNPNLKYIGAFIVLNALDAVLTLGVLHNGGSEASPIIRIFVGMGTNWFLLYKIITTLVIAAFLLAVRPSIVRLVDYTFLGLVIFMLISFVVSSII